MGRVLFDWHKFPELPDDKYSGDTLFIVYHKALWYPTQKDGCRSAYGRWTDQMTFALYSAEEQAFYDDLIDEYKWEGRETADGSFKAIETWWTLAEDPTMMVNDNIYDALVDRGNIEPWSEEKEPDPWEIEERYESLHADDKWKRMHGE